MIGEFSVTQFMNDDIHETVRERVGADEAVDAAKFFTSNVAAKVGLTKRVIITDGDDCTVFEWRYGEGVVFPLRDGRP